MCGVYVITCKPTGEMYVGGTTLSFDKRFKLHDCALRRGAGPPKLQEAYNAHGPDAFEYRALKTFPVDQVMAREKEAIRRLKPALNVYHGPSAVVVEAMELTGLTKQAVLYRLRQGLDLTKPRRQGRVAEQFLVDGEMLTMHEIAERTGLSWHGVRHRMAKQGLKGKALLAKKT